VGFESELRSLEARVYALPVGALEARLARLEQGLAQAWAAPSGVCPVAFDFTVTDAAGGAPVAGAVVTLTNPGGFPVATGSTDAAGLVTLDAFAAGPYTYTAAAAGYTTGTGTVSGSCGGVVPVAAALTGAGVATSFCGATLIPVALQVASTGDAFYGAHTVALNWNGSFGRWEGCGAAPYLGGGSCPAGSTPRWYRLDTGGALSIQGRSTTGAVPCPDTAASCSSTPNTSAIGIGGYTLVSCSPLRLTFHSGLYTVTP
jgi:hypothetical protein